MTVRFAPVHPGVILQASLQAKERRSGMAKNSSAHPRLVSQIIHALNQKARYDLAGRKGKARRTS